MSNDLLQRAKQYIQANRIASAERLYEWLLEREPNNIQAHFGLGMLLFNANDFEHAAQHFQCAHDAAPNNPDIIVRLAETLRLHRRFQEAITLCQGELKSAPKHEGIHYEYVLALTENAQWDTAQSEAQAFATQYTNTWKTDFLTGNILYKQGKHEEALTHLLKSHEKYRMAVPPILAYCDIVGRQKKYDWAISNLEGVIKHFPKNVEALLQLANLMRERKEPAKRRQYIEQAFACAPQSPEVQSAYAALLLDEGDAHIHAALAHANNAIHTDPNHSNALHALAQCYEKLGQRSQAMRYARASIFKAASKDALHAFARLALPGAGHDQHLEALHRAIQPKRYIEIGIGDGSNLALAKSCEQCLGIDPAPRVRYHFKSPTRIFQQDSLTFFKDNHLGSHMGGLIDMAVLGGGQSFRTTLHELKQLEVYSHPDTLFVLRGSYPLADRLSGAKPDPHLWYGDNWKIVFVLKDLCPQVQFATLPSHPAGMTLLKNISAIATFNEDQWEQAIAKHADTLPSSIADPEPLLNTVANTTNAALSALNLPNA